MSFGLYVLDADDKPQLVCSRPSDQDGLMHWARWMHKAEESGRKRIAFDTLPDGTEVSTAFLGINLNWSASGRPLVFETAIFDRNGCEVVGRKGSMHEARALHEATLQTLRAAKAH